MFRSARNFILKWESQLETHRSLNTLQRVVLTKNVASEELYSVHCTMCVLGMFFLLLNWLYQIIAEFVNITRGNFWFCKYKVGMDNVCSKKTCVDTCLFMKHFSLGGYAVNSAFFTSEGWHCCRCYLAFRDSCPRTWSLWRQKTCTPASQRVKWEQ